MEEGMFKLRHCVVAAIALCSLVPALVAAEEAKPATEPLRFGAPVTVKKPVNLARLAKKPAKFAGQSVRMEGTVKAVCQGRGCWVEVESPRGGSFMARSLDESVLVPKDCQGRRIVVQGVVMLMPQQTAEEHKQGAEVEGHACPQPKFVVSTQGVELAAAK